MKTIKMQWIIPCALLVFNVAYGSGDDCPLTKGLFERRSALIADRGAYRREASDTTSASKELETINEKYFQFMLRVSNGEGQYGRELECCAGTVEDPVAQVLCKFVKYLRTGRKDHRLLLESVPTDPRGRQALWALEPIAFYHAERDAKNIPALFKPSGPVALYLDELYRLIDTGDKEALSKYLELYRYSDGEHAEQMDDQMEKLLNNDVDLVLREWEVFKRDRDVLVKFLAFLPNEEKSVLISKLDANKECAVRSDACNELKTLLSVKTSLKE
jgi:hypothetical protein